LVGKPLTAFGEYSLDELAPMVIFDPDWYVHAFTLSGTFQCCFTTSPIPKTTHPRNVYQDNLRKYSDFSNNHKARALLALLQQLP
jgi:hypothetical protein